MQAGQHQALSGVQVHWPGFQQAPLSLQKAGAVHATYVEATASTALRILTPQVCMPSVLRLLSVSGYQQG